VDAEYARRLYRAAPQTEMSALVSGSRANSSRGSAVVARGIPTLHDGGGGEGDKGRRVAGNEISRSGNTRIRYGDSAARAPNYLNNFIMIASSEFHDRARAATAVALKMQKQCPRADG